MSTSVTIAASQVVQVLSEDLEREGCVARTLISHPDLPEGHLLLPLHADGLRISGLVIPNDEVEADRWAKLPKPMRWVANASPVVGPRRGLAFLSRAEFNARRVAEVAEVVEGALTRTGTPLLDRVALLDHADGRVGGHPITAAGRLALADVFHDEPQVAVFLGAPALLRRRFHEVAPDGLESLKRELNRQTIRCRLGNETINALTGAATRADQPNGVLHANAWESCAESTLWTWWLHWKAVSRRKTPRQLLSDLGLPYGTWTKLAAGEVADPLERLADEAILPDRSERLEELRDAHDLRQPTRDRLRAVQPAHAPRLMLFSRQLAELERALGRDRLTSWVQARAGIRAVRRALDLRSFDRPWQAAEFAANEMRRLVPDLAPGNAITRTPELLEGIGLALAGAVLPFAGQQGGASAPEDAAPVLFTTSAGRRSVGAARFAVFHQLGHLVAGHEMPCTMWATDRRARHPDDGEAFANAFAAYFLAPRAAVTALSGRSGRHLPQTWIQHAARDTAIHFGLGPAAALAHVANCLERNPDALLKRLDSDRNWVEWRKVVGFQVEPDWREDADAIAASSGGQNPPSGVEAALGRPQSRYFDALLTEAADRQLVAADLPKRFAVTQIPG